MITEKTDKVEGKRLEVNKNPFIFPFEKLDVWQMSVDLAKKILSLLENLPHK